MRPTFSRGGSTLTFERHRVSKIGTTSELNKLSRFPLVFVPVIKSDDLGDGRVHIVMPRLRPPDVATEGTDALLAGIGLLKRQLWPNLDLFPQPPWREALWWHLRKTWGSTDSVTRLVDRLPEPVHPCEIHGDPTLANVLYDRKRRCWVWCDPLDRAYVPHDPHVDLGKAFQSCWGYERLLLGEIRDPTFDLPLAEELARLSGLNFSHANSWCYVHLIRLLPYQESFVAARFTEVLKRAGF